MLPFAGGLSAGSGERSRFVSFLHDLNGLMLALAGGLSAGNVVRSLVSRRAGGVGCGSEAWPEFLLATASGTPSPFTSPAATCVGFGWSWRRLVLRHSASSRHAPSCCPRLDRGQHRGPPGPYERYSSVLSGQWLGRKRHRVGSGFDWWPAWVSVCRSGTAQRRTAIDQPKRRSESYVSCFSPVWRGPHRRVVPQGAEKLKVVPSHWNSMILGGPAGDRQITEELGGPKSRRVR